MGENEYDCSGDGLSRRDYLKGVGAAGAAVVGFDTGVNHGRLYKNGQAPSQHESSVYEPAVERVLDGKPLEVHTAYVHFSEGQDYNGDAIAHGVEQTLEELDGVEVDAYWHDIAVTPDAWMAATRESGSDREVGEDEAHDAVADFQSNVESVREAGEVRELTGTMIDFLEQYDPEITKKEALTGIVTDVGDVSLKGKSYKGACIVDEFTNQELPGANQNRVMNLLSHEYAHELGLEHTYNPYDVMSYGLLKNQLGNHARIGFSAESHANWQETHEAYKET